MHNNPLLSEDELAHGIRAHDEAAFEQLFASCAEALTRHLAGMLREEAAADDVIQDLIQETFLRVWTRAEQWNGMGSIKAWLYRIATNLALNHLRSMRRHPLNPLPGEDEWSEDEDTHAPGWLVDSTTMGPDAVAEQSEQHHRLRQMINGLSEEKREVFRMVHEMELSIRDAANQLGIPEGTVKSRLHYAQKILAEAWRAPNEEINP
jgi:RNA polymerase sigma factor (sigma-70 family)